MDLQKFFLEDNKSGHKTTEKFLEKKYPHIIMEIKSFSKKNNIENITFKEQIYLFINNITSVPICNNIECEKPLKFKKSLNEGYGKYCSVLCTNSSEDHKNRVKQTNYNKYGGPAPINSEIIQEKIKDTNMERYGVKNIFENVDYIKEKTQERYGVDHISKLKSKK